jgi:hypothetical protein
MNTVLIILRGITNTPAKGASSGDPARQYSRSIAFPVRWRATCPMHLRICGMLHVSVARCLLHAAALCCPSPCSCRRVHVVRCMLHVAPGRFRGRRYRGPCGAA